MAYDESFEYRGGNPYLKAIIGDSRWTDGSRMGGDPLELKIGFSGNGTAGDWQLWEIQSFMKVLESIEAVANIDFVIAKESEADFVQYKDKELDPSWADGWHHYPDAWGANEGHYDVDDLWAGTIPEWTTLGLAAGGKSGWLILHEIGHALGLAHPHDDDACSSTWPGVTSAGDMGDGSNNSLNTLMSYNVISGYDLFGNPIPLQSPNFGATAGPMAYDIAALQLMYGANTTHNDGNDVYVLPDNNAPGTFWSCIWDTRGTDTIAYYGNKDATINLQAATLVGPKGGGELSNADGVLGGFTIANKVVIENAQGGTGNDEITGNEADNELSGLGGNDTIHGEGGTDHIYGGDGNDYILGGEGPGFLYGGRNDDSIHGGSLRDEIYGEEGDDSLYGYGGNDDLWGGEGADEYFGGDGNDYIRIDAMDTSQGATWLWLNGGEGYDRVITDPDSGAISLRLADTLVEYVRGSGFGDVIDGSNVNYALTLNGDGGADTITGGNASDTLIGEGGNDTFIASGGKDRILGGGDQDTYDFSAMTSSTVVDLSRGYATGAQVVADTLNSIENVRGGSGADTITGSGVANFLFGGAGRDTINGLAGQDHIIGGADDDILYGGADGDTFYFDAFSGHDTIKDWTKYSDQIVIDGHWQTEDAANFNDISFDIVGRNVVIGYEDAVITVEHAAGYLTLGDIHLV